MGSERCRCGRSYVGGHPDDEADHRATHGEYERGPSVPGLTSLPGAAVAGHHTVWIDASLPERVRNEAARVAYVECLELDRPVCYDGTDAPERPRLVLALDEERAVGMVMLADTDAFWTLRWQDDRIVVDENRTRTSKQRLAVGRVWIAADYRGRGLASAMLRHIAKRYEIKPCDMVWTIPLTRDGAQLVRTLCPAVWLADGDWTDLDETLGEQD